MSGNDRAAPMPPGSSGSLVAAARHVGCRTGEIADPVQHATIPLRWLYPCTLAGQPERFGPYRLDVAIDAPAAGSGLPLVVISHGGGGSALTHRDLAIGLARAGHVVALPEHPGNCRSDNSLDGTLANLQNRPRHLRLAIDASLAHAALGACIASDQVAVIGHSMGGYGALALAGGHPVAAAHERAEGVPQGIPVERDRRVRALVLLAPACGWFAWEGALDGVDLPILLRAAERDHLARHLHVDAVVRGIGARGPVDFLTVANAGHHSFQSPFPAELRRADFAPAQDPAGFDRSAYQQQLQVEVLAFLRRVL